MGLRGQASGSRFGYILNTDLLEKIWAHDELADLDVGQRRLALRALIAEEEIECSIADLADWIDGWGPLSGLMRDPRVTDVLVNGPRDVWAERSGSLTFEGVLFEDSEDLSRLVERLLGEAGAQADASHPVVDARLADGARIHVVLPPVAPAGPLVSIRRFPRQPLTMDDLLSRGMFDARDAAALTAAVEQRLTVAISGGTGTGKTTLLNALLGCVGDDERVVVVEETPELQPPCRHAVSLVARPPNSEGRGEVDLNSLVRATLRMRPDRIVVGEVRGPEALAALTAMATGHAGSLVTIHARSGPEALDRMVSLALSARTGLSEEALRAAVETAIDVTVQLERVGGVRRVSAIRYLR
ncbi:MAG: pilus assembly protein CpaF [Actinomycetota bacterium]|nr:pilus assembly protein CpaF [Actinomycetota bacterium]